MGFGLKVSPRRPRSKSRRSEVRYHWQASGDFLREESAVGHWGVKSYEIDEADEALDSAFEQVHGAFMKS